MTVRPRTHPVQHLIMADCHHHLMSSISVLSILSRLNVKELVCSRDDEKVGLIRGGNSALVLFIMMLSKGALSAHRKINIGCIEV